MKLAVFGAGGRMGRAIVRLACEAGDIQIVGAVDAPGSAALGRDVGEWAQVSHLGVEVSADLGSALLGADVLIDFTIAGAFDAMLRAALKAHPDAQISRRIYDEAAVTFDSLFLAGKGDALPAIEALSLFYDFRELTPIGRRGDEMIRRLADRLVAVDLLPQAAELLQYQIDNRLQGAARSQVATRLVHSADERARVDDLELGVEFLRYAAQAMS